MEKAGIPPGLLHASAVLQPTKAEIHQLSEDLDLKCTVEEEEAFYEHYKGVLKSYQTVYELPDPQLPVRYPRLPGQREQVDNAWYWRCDIKGADSGLLAGKTVAIKDSIAVAGVPMMNGTKLLEGYTPEFDATVVTRVLDAGGHILGKAACDDMCLSGGSWSSSTGPIVNPCDPYKDAGGSSSGCASLVARGIVDMAIGADQGGSIRTPASYCGIVGMKPTYGLIPYTGAMGGAVTIDHLGPMTRTVEDCALLLEALAGFDDDRDPRQRPIDSIPPYSKLFNRDVSGRKVGVLTEGFLGVDADVDKCVNEKLSKLSEAGVVLKDVSIPIHQVGTDIFVPITVEGSHACGSHGYGTGYLWKGYYPVTLQEAMARGSTLRPYDLPINLKMRRILGEYMRRNYQNKFYARSQNLVPVLKKAYDDALKDVDVLVMPTMSKTAESLPFTESTAKERLAACMEISNNLASFDATGHPALSLNAGYSGQTGLPVGLQVVGRLYDDLSVLQIAFAIERV
ncbi:amidase-like [Ylistrum balloti]|uniref:amidase-like n=1 Tax=Ylistrum balloti TaxID=509963 RepID=UPI002905B623|nr:amidase-like [Ylistrum balloti]